MPLGDYVLQDGRGQNMCGKHERVLRGCSFCDRAFLPAGARDDRCPRCRSYAIEREVDADRRYRQIQDWFAGHRLILPRPPPLELSDRMSGDAGQLYQAGYVEFLERGFGAGALRIILRRGMPVELFLIVLVHEVSHVWLRHHYYFPDLPKTMEEGVCQWVALAFARGLATAEGQWQARR